MPVRPATVLPIFLVVGLFGTTCTPDDPWTSNNPEYALNAFLTALNLGDHATAWEFLGPQTRRFLADNYRQQQKALGNPTQITAEIDLMQGLFRVWTPSTLEIERLETVDRTENHATIRVHSVFSVPTEVELTRAEDRWTVELVGDLPPQTQ